MTQSDLDLITDGYFPFTMDGATYRADQNGVIERQDGGTWTVLSQDEGVRVFDAWTAPSADLP